jgi:hypothetical protein
MVVEPQALEQGARSERVSQKSPSAHPDSPLVARGESAAPAHPQPAVAEAAAARATGMRLAHRAFVAAWSVFWLLQFTIAAQDFQRAGHTGLWKPFLWEGTSFLVASLIAGLHWRHLHRLDPLLHQPGRWFAVVLLGTPVVSIGFVAVVFGLRHGVHALVGVPYVHDTWVSVFLYEPQKFAMFYLLFMAIAFGMRSFAAMSEARISAERARAVGEQAKLLQLTQQIEPHFLFNALNTIAEAVHSDPDLAESMLLRLASLMRAATDLSRKPESSLDEELLLLEAYTAIMCERFAGRVDVRFEIEPGARECPVPTFILQPLVENAFRHGVERCTRPCRLIVRAWRADERLALEVEDDAGELAPDRTFGVGLSNVEQRLSTRYGQGARLRLRGLPVRGVVARIELPCAP